jgi:alkyl sulfatase BDS1-like metallo-beta-lactamase superfamily hydrolase
MNNMNEKPKKRVAPEVVSADDADHVSFKPGVGLGSAGAFFPGPATPFADRCLLIVGHGNVAFAYNDDGVLMVDTGTPVLFGDHAVRELRKHTDAPIHTVFYTHGHIDHAFNVPPVLADAQKHGYPPPRILAHENVPRRFQRYDRLRGQTSNVNRINFDVPGDVELPIVPPFFYPDAVFSEAMRFTLGDMTVEVRFAPSETDDHAYAWVPERRVVFAGDLLLSCFPNIGNPLKVQRFTEGWALALEEMAALRPIAAAPGHGPVILGEDAVQEVLLETARALHYLHDEVVRRLNEGQPYAQILAEVDLPDDLKQKPFLAPIYGAPVNVVHAVIRQYGGWWDYKPSHLHPAPDSEVAAAVLALIGDGKAVVARARHLAEEGQSQLALHLLDLVLDASAADVARAEALRLQADLLDARKAQMPDFISANILKWAANQARREADSLEKP